MKLHAISGLPRSGSTVLGAILNQNPKFYASPTSNISQIVGGISAQLSSSPELRSLIAGDRVKTEARVLRSMTAFVEGWYKGHKIVFDKGRGWTTNSLLFRQLFPKGKIIVTVRDLRSVFSSIEKQHQAFPAFDSTDMPKTLYDRADQMFSKGGMIGSCVEGVEDVMRRNLPHCLLVPYERFIVDPQALLKSIYEFIEEPWFEHDLKNIPEETEDSGYYDIALLNKFPHTVRKEFGGPNGTWDKYVSKDLAQLIINRFPGYNKAFGYQ